jgi:hypothetical protein
MVASIVGQLVIGWLLADFLAGLFHWWEDRVGRVDMPLIGPWVIVPNRLHHRDAMAFLRKSFLPRNWTAAPPVALISGLWFLLLGPGVIWASATLGGFLAVEVHYQAHLPSTTNWRVRWILRPLWDIGLVQSPAHHNHHHRWEDRAYCPLTGWLNPILDAAGFWRGLEVVLAGVGLEPNRGPA